VVTGYNLHLDKDKDTMEFNKYVRIGEEHLSGKKATISKNLEKYIINGMVDGTKMEKDWFPQIEADVFISHSHADVELAKGLAGWLNSYFGLTCFIDSCVWGYADHLLEIINDKYSDKQDKPSGGCEYDHRKCNTASKHVNTMLTIALHKMIDKAEITILLNTNSSIKKYEDVYQQATYSPWIYSEIVCTEIVRRKLIAEYRKKPYLEYSYDNNQARNDGFSAAYEVSLDHLESLDMQKLLEWKNLYDRCNATYPLDCLYKLTYKSETEKIPVSN
jgi:hypothetical protein